MPKVRIIKVHTTVNKELKKDKIFILEWKEN